MNKVRSVSLRPLANEFTNTDHKGGRPRTAHGIPDPRADVDSLVRTVEALKEQVEILNRERGYLDDSAITVGDFPRLRELLLNAPANGAMHGLVDGQWRQLAFFKPLAAAPTNPAIGMVVYANGTGWNPGNGAGLYLFKAGGWVFIA